MNTITDISCPSIDLCWASGHDATILHSNDGGKNWVIQYEDFDFDAPLLSIHMFDELHGVAVGAFALSLRTSNGGKSWGFLFISEDGPLGVGKINNNKINPIRIFNIVGKRDVDK